MANDKSLIRIKFNSKRSQTKIRNTKSIFSFDFIHQLYCQKPQIGKSERSAHGSKLPDYTTVVTNHHINNKPKKVENAFSRYDDYNIY